MVSSGRFGSGNGRLALKSRASGRVDLWSVKKRIFGVCEAAGGLFPRLRRKSGLCYTADANSPFEAYIYVR